MKGYKMNNILEIVKKEIEERFFEYGIEELENESFEDFMEYLDEVMYCDFGIEIRDFENEVEELYYELKDEYLNGKIEDYENEREIKLNMYK